MKYISYAFIGLAAIATLGSCGGDEEQKEEVIRPVRYEVIGIAGNEKSRSFSGVASAGDEIGLSFRSNGVITEMNVTVGQKVEEGDLLVKLDNVQAKLAYEQSLSSLNSTKSAMNTAKSSLERAKALYEKGSYSLSQYETAKNNFQNALDGHESAKRKLQIDQTQINYGYIYAPSAGVVAATHASLNETVSAGQVIAVLNAGEKINISVGIPESVINKIDVGMSADIDFTSLDNGEFEGNVIEISPILDPQTSTFPVKVNINNPSESIKPGMVSKITFNFGNSEEQESNQVIIPVKSVGEDGEGNFVFVIETTDGEIGAAIKTHIELGELTNEGFVVKSGLELGQKIATAGLQSLLNGQKVKIQD